jgi:hypothetical protein
MIALCPGPAAPPSPFRLPSERWESSLRLTGTLLKTQADDGTHVLTWWPKPQLTFRGYSSIMVANRDFGVAIGEVFEQRNEQAKAIARHRRPGRRRRTDHPAA